MAPRTSQYKAIYALATRIWGRGDANEQLHDLVYRQHRKESLRDLSVREADELIDLLRGVDNNVPEGVRVSRERQIKKIAKLGYLLGWTSRGIRGLIEEVTGKRDWNDLDKREADRVIRRMDQILKGKLKKLESDYAPKENESGRDR
jgi:hypothetical protein